MYEAVFSIGEFDIKCIYTITQVGKDPDALEYTVYNITYTSTLGDRNYNPSKIKMFFKGATIEIGHRPNQEIKTVFMQNLKAGILKHGRRSIKRPDFEQFYNDNAD